MIARPGILRGSTPLLAGICCALATLASCGGGGEREDGGPALEDCPADHLLWARAFNQASNDETVSALRERGVSLRDRCPGMWQPLWMLGSCHYALGDRESAGEVFQGGLTMAEAQDSAAGIALFKYEISWIHRDRAELKRAETLSREALAASRESGRDDLRALCSAALGATLLETGDFEESLQLHEEAIGAYERLGWDRNVRWISLNKAVLLIELGDLAAARRQLETIHEESLRVEDGYIEVRAVTNLGNLEFLAGNLERADGWYERIPEDAVEQRAFANFARGRIALRRGDTVEARERLRSAGDQQEQRVVALLARAFLGLAEAQAGNSHPGEEVLRAVIQEADEGGAEEPAWIARWLLGRVLAPGDESVELFREAVRIIDGQGENVNPLEQGLRFLSERSEPYVALATALADRGDDAVEEVFSAIEKTHARALRRALRDHRRVEGGWTLESVRNGLSDGEVILDYLIGEESGVLLAITQGEARAMQIAGNDELAEPLRRYRLALRRPLQNSGAYADPMADLQRSIRHGHRLRELLLAGVEDLVEAADRVFVVPDARLALLPFAALPSPDGAEFLGQKREIALLPLAGAPPDWRRERRPILLAGDPLPDDSGEFPRLPATAAELDRISETWGGTDYRLLQNADLTLDRLLELPLGSFATLHFATHAIASTADPRGCAVYLSKGERLALDRIVELELTASPLVVLSACRTGDGELIPGEGVVGLGWAFLRAGAEGVIVSLWSVEDEATAEMMVALHRRMREGDDPVAALATAQRETALGHPHPAYWAPFVLVGRPETPLPPR